jgi:hypothetical protein
MNSIFINELLVELLQPIGLHKSYYDPVIQMSAFSFLIEPGRKLTRSKNEVSEPKISSLSVPKEVVDFKNLVIFSASNYPKTDYPYVLIIVTDNNNLYIVSKMLYPIDGWNVEINNKSYDIRRSLFLRDIINDIYRKQNERDEEDIDPMEIYNYIRQDL